MCQGTAAFLAGWAVLSLSACADSPHAPASEAEDNVTVERANHGPTVAVTLGPLPDDEGCTIGWPSALYESAAYDVNADGIVVGETLCVAGEVLTFRWSSATGMEQLAQFPGGYGIKGGSINKHGYIAAIYSTNSLSEDFRPILWTPGNTRIDLTGPAGCDGGNCPAFDVAVSDINNKNVVVGLFEGPFRWSEATGLVILGALENRTPVGINRQGDIAAAGPAGTVLLSKTGALKEISGFASQDVNSKREVVGATGTWPTVTAALWAHPKGIRTLGTLGGDISVAYGINNNSEVVGSSTNSSGEQHAFYWTASRGMVDLGPGVAYAISDAGHIVGFGPSEQFDAQEDTPRWQATLWRGTGGVAPSSMTARAGAMRTTRAAACFEDGKNWESKPGLLRCLARQR